MTDKLEWMPINPCTPDCIHQGDFCPSHFGCGEYLKYEAEISAQKKLLEYLIKQIAILLNAEKDIASRSSYKLIIDVLNRMLKQIEVK